MQIENYYLYNSYDFVFAVDRKIVAKLNNFMEFLRNENALADGRLQLMEIAGIEGNGLPTGQLNVNPVDEIDLVYPEEFHLYLPPCSPPSIASGLQDAVATDAPKDEDDNCRPEIKRPKRKPLPKWNSRTHVKEAEK